MSKLKHILHYKSNVLTYHLYKDGTQLPGGVSLSDVTTSSVDPTKILIPIDTDFSTKPIWMKYNGKFYQRDAKSTTNLDYGEIAINYRTDNEKIFIKNSSNKIVEFSPLRESNGGLLGGVKSNSNSTSGCNICPIKDGYVYYKNTTYSLGGGNGTATVTLTPSSGTATSITINNVENATSASKLVSSTDKGSGTNPVYFKNGVPVACSYTLGQSVTNTSKLTDTTYSISGTNTNKVTLTASSGGTSSVIVNNVAYATSAGTADTSKYLHEAKLIWGGGDFSGDYGCIDAAMVGVLGANRFSFLNPKGIEIEYSRDGGSSWKDYGADDAMKLGLFSTGTGLTIGKSDEKNKYNEKCLLRIIITTDLAKIYTSLNKFCIYVSTSGSSGSYCKIETANVETPDKFVLLKDKTRIDGWSGYNIINTSSFATYGNSDGQKQKIRFTFGCTGGNTNYNGLTIYQIMGFGGVGWTTPSTMAKTGHLYDYDYNQNATFPAAITASRFYGNLSGNATSSTSATTASKLSDSVDVGSTTQPVYFLNGLPKLCSHTLGKSVPSNAVFTDHTYTLSGNNTNKVKITPNLGPAQEITINNVANADTAGSVTWGNVSGKPSSFNPSSHDHNNATTGADGFMSAADKKKLDGIEAGANNFTYTLPEATLEKLGGVKAAGKESTDTLAIHIDGNGLLWTKPIAGEKGPKGDKGETGATGERGPVGPQGPSGSNGSRGPQGYYFTPSVDTSGNLSWSNNGSLSNPTTVNIKGPKGDKGETGATGGKGATGERGPVGPQGPEGGKGATGPYYRPSVDTSGNLSWSNNGSLSNPTTVNIKGPKGDKGETGATGGKGATGERGPVGPQGPEGGKGATGPYYRPSVDTSGNLSWSNNGSLSNPTTVNIKGPKGDKGETGATGGKGATGPYYRPSVDTSGNISWQNTGGLSNPTTVNIKGPKGEPGKNGSTPIIKCAAGPNINVVGTPTVTAKTSGITTTFTFDYLKGEQGAGGFRPVGIKPLQFGLCKNEECHALSTYDGTNNYTFQIEQGRNMTIETTHDANSLKYTFHANVPTIQDWLLRDGTKAMTGTLTLKENLAHSGGKTGLNAKNSSITGIGSLVFEDGAELPQEGIEFPRTDVPGNYDSIRLYNGNAFFETKHSYTGRGTENTMWHSGNFKVAEGNQDSKLYNGGDAYKISKNKVTDELYVNIPTSQSGGTYSKIYKNIAIKDPYNYSETISNFANNSLPIQDNKIDAHIAICNPLYVKGISDVVLNSFIEGLYMKIGGLEKPVFLDIWLNYNLLSTEGNQNLYTEVYNTSEICLGYTNMINTKEYSNVSFMLNPSKGIPYINDNYYLDDYRGIESLGQFFPVAVHIFGTMNKKLSTIPNIFLSVYIMNNDSMGLPSK